jgi:hypothetical protein
MLTKLEWSWNIFVPQNSDVVNAYMRTYETKCCKVNWSCGILADRHSKVSSKTN